MIEISLSRSIQNPNGSVDKIVLREPTARDYFALGEPHTLAQTRDGLVLTAEKEDIIRGYIERLVVEPKQTLLLDQLALEDAIRVKEAVLDFFVAARLAISPGAATSSSSS